MTTAGYAAIAATSSALVELLFAARQGTEFSGAAVSLYQPKDFLTSPETDTISLYLFRVAVNGANRNIPAPRAENGRRPLQPLPLDLCYLLTAWSSNAVQQHKLLGWAARTLADAAKIPAALLNAQIRGATVFENEFSAELIFETLSIQDMASIWELNKANQRPSFTLTARLIPLASERFLSEAGPVQTRLLASRPEVRQ